MWILDQVLKIELEYTFNLNTIFISKNKNAVNNKFGSKLKGFQRWNSEILIFNFQLWVIKMPIICETQIRKQRKYCAYCDCPLLECITYRK